MGKVNNAKEKLKFKKQNLSKILPIGQTLETKDKYLPHDKNTQKLKESRPIIILKKIKNPQGEEEYEVAVGTRSVGENTKKYNKFGIKRIRNHIEVFDAEGKPIKLNEKFVLTSKCTQLPQKEVDKLIDYLLYHTKQSSGNIKKNQEFVNRYKKSKR